LDELPNPSSESKLIFAVSGFFTEFKEVAVSVELIKATALKCQKH